MDRKTETIQANQSLDMLITDAIALIQYARQITAKQVNLVQLMTYYSLGKWIVEEQQEGEERATYGKQVLKKLSESLTKNLAKDFLKRTWNMPENFISHMQIEFPRHCLRNLQLKNPRQCLRN